MLPSRPPLQSRAERLDVSLPVEFVYDSETAKGHCLNVSESGLLVNFRQALELWLVGQISVRFGPDTVKVKARVARVNGREVGLSFLFAGDQERAAVRTLVSFAHTQNNMSERPPF